LDQFVAVRPEGVESGEQGTGQVHAQHHGEDAGARAERAGVHRMGQAGDLARLEPGRFDQRDVGVAVESLGGVAHGAGAGPPAQVDAVAAGHRQRAVDFDRQPHHRKGIADPAVVGGQEHRQCDAAQAQGDVGRHLVLDVGPLHARPVAVVQVLLADHLQHGRPALIETDVHLGAEPAVDVAAPPMGVAGATRLHRRRDEIGRALAGMHGAERAEARKIPARPAIGGGRGIGEQQAGSEEQGVQQADGQGRGSQHEVFPVHASAQPTG
jgi:hypothetical protein